jgi:hypothetical protein
MVVILQRSLGLVISSAAILSPYGQLTMGHEGRVAYAQRNQGIESQTLRGLLVYCLREGKCAIAGPALSIVKAPRVCGARVSKTVEPEREVEDEENRVHGNIERASIENSTRAVEWR